MKKVLFSFVICFVFLFNMLVSVGSVYAQGTLKMGDINGDYIINVNDVLILLQSITGKIDLTSEQALAADMNKDSSVDVSDALMMLITITRGEQNAGVNGTGIRMLHWGYGTSEPKFTTALEKTLALDYISGADLYIEWKTIQPNEGEFNWYHFDKAIEIAKKYNKTVSLGVTVASMSPQWVKDKSETFTYTHIHPSIGVQTAPVPWSKGYTDALSTLVLEMGKRYNNNPNVYYVVVNGPATLYGVETNWPMKAGTISEADLAKLDFSLEKWAQGWKDSFDLFMTAFPNTKLSLAMHHDIGYPGFTTEEKVAAAESIRDYALEKYNTTRNEKLMLALLGLHANSPRGFTGPYTDYENLNEYISLLWDVKEKAVFTFESTQIWRYPNVGNTVGYDAEFVKRVLDNGIFFRADTIKVKVPDIWDINTNSPYAPYADVIKAAAETLANDIKLRQMN